VSDIKYSKIVIAGTPGVGKTTVSEILARRLNAVHVDLSKLAIEKNLILYYDEERESYVIDELRLVEEVARIVNLYERVIIDTHYPEVLPRDLVDIVVVLRLRPDELEKRLAAKKWPLRKIRENVLAEILSVVAINAFEKFGELKVYELNATGLTIEEVVERIIDLLRHPTKYEPGIKIDWLLLLSPEEVTKYSSLGEGLEP